MNIINTILNNYRLKLIDIKNTENEKFINETISKIYVINLKKDRIRRNYIKVIMKKYNINFTFVKVYEIDNDTYHLLNEKNLLTRGEVGCMLSHLWCLRDIIQHNYKNAIIFEDDIIFHKHFHSLFEKIYNSKYNFLILGACDFSFNSMNKYNVINNLYVPNKNSKKVYGAHGNYYSLLGAKKMFEIRTMNISFFDKDYYYMFEYFKDSSYICYPNLVVSDISTTNLEHRYPFFSIEEKNYYEKCFTNFHFKHYHFIYLCILIENKHITIEDTDDYESYMRKIIYVTFFNSNYANKIFKRITKKFFTINDIKYILFN
jgi:glycosyl transferase family 25